MIIDVKEIKRQIGSKKNYTAQRKISLNEVNSVADVDIDINITNARSRLIVRGTLSTIIELSCSRCAEDYTQSIDITLNEQFLPEGSPEAKSNKELSLADLSVFTYKDDEIDLDEIIRQNIYSALPIKPLCKPECKGLCSMCGESLRSKKCDCKKEDVDPRLTPLLKFKNKISLL